MMHQLLEVSGPGFLQKIARHAVEGKHSEATEEVRMLDASNIIESCSTEVNQLLAAGECWNLLRHDWRTYLYETVAFRVLARSSGSAQVLLKMRWTYPTKWFWLLRHPD